MGVALTHAWRNVHADEVEQCRDRVNHDGVL
jgi:hypothetical protein